MNEENSPEEQGGISPILVLGLSITFLVMGWNFAKMYTDQVYDKNESMFIFQNCRENHKCGYEKVNSALESKYKYRIILTKESCKK